MLGSQLRRGIRLGAIGVAVVAMAGGLVVAGNAFADESEVPASYVTADDLNRTDTGTWSYDYMLQGIFGLDASIPACGDTGAWSYSAGNDARVGHRNDALIGEMVWTVTESQAQLPPDEADKARSAIAAMASCDGPVARNGGTVRFIPGDNFVITYGSWPVRDERTGTVRTAHLLVADGVVGNRFVRLSSDVAVPRAASPGTPGSPDCCDSAEIPGGPDGITWFAHLTEVALDKAA